MVHPCPIAEHCGFYYSDRMSSNATHESASRVRTRKAIMDAAFTVLGQRPTASLGDIAEAAGIGRSTLHRYFPERSELIAALAEQAVETMTRAVEEAALDTGTPDQALRRVIRAYFDFSPVLMFLTGEAQVRNQVIAGVESADRPVLRLIERGQREGYFATDVPATWINRVLGWIVYAGIESVREDEAHRYTAVELVIRTFERGVLAGPA